MREIRIFLRDHPWLAAANWALLWFTLGVIVEAVSVLADGGL